MHFERSINFDIPLARIDREMLWNCLERLIEVVSTLEDINFERELGRDAGLTRGIILSSSSDGSDIYLSVSTKDAVLPLEQTNRMSALFAGSELVVLELSEYSPGLMIIKGAVDLHNGWMFIEKNLDRALTFKIVLPSIRTEHTNPAIDL